MRATFFKPFRKSFVSIVIILSGYVVWACADGFWTDGEGSNYAPEAFVDSAYTPFFYSAMFYYDINYDTEHNSRFSNINVQDWSGYIGAAVKETELDFLLNKASKGCADSAAQYLTGEIKIVPSSISNFTIIRGINNEKIKRFFRYLVHAKACESFSVKEFKYWDYQKTETTVLDTAYSDVYDEMNSAFTASQDEFVRQRYWFQLIRYNYYFNEQAAITLFENHKNSFAKNTIYYRAMACAAGVFYKQKNYAKANYYYSLVFAGNDKLKTVAHWSFHPQQEADWQQTLALCTNNEERAALWQMLGIFYKDEKRSIQEIYKLDPKSARMDVLLTRLVNKNESGNNPYLYWEEKKINKEDRSALLQWLTQVADKGNTSNPFLWNVSVGYLYFINDNFSAAEAYYKKAGGQLPNTSLAANQLKLLVLLNRIGALNGIKPADEERLLPELKWLYAQNHQTALPEFRYYEAQRWIKETMAKKYKLQNDNLKAECFVSASEFYVNDKNIEQLKMLLTKKNQTSYEQFCASMSAKKAEDLWAFQAIRDAFGDNIDGAIKKMEKAGNDAAIVLAGNPFNGKIKDCHDCDHLAPQKIKYSKLAFLKKLKEMKDNIAKGSDIYNNAMLLGHAFYNMSHYGNARYFYESSVLGSGHYSPFSIDSVFMPLLTDNSLAKKYYRLALTKAADDEQKAKCNYMIAKCDRNKWYNQHYYTNKKNIYRYDDQIYIDWKIFDGLNKYSHTKYYQEVLKECGYFDIYLRAKNK